MDKSTLQVRAENAAHKFKQKARRPIVIEFAGVPKAGKTTTLNTIHSFLKRCGFRVETVIERASVCPIRDKKHFNFNVWTACTSLAQILEKTQKKTQDHQSDSDPEILILDRGIFDSLSWLSMMEKMGRLRKEERKAIEDFLLIADWRERMAGVIVMTTSPKDAMAREGGLLPVQAKGSIMNEQVIQQMLANTNSCMDRFRNKFNIVSVDTSSSKGGTAKKTAEEVAGIVLSMIEGELDEEILSIDQSHFDGLMRGRDFIGAADAQSLVNLFAPNSQGAFGLRDVVEQDLSRIQALPVVVIRNKSGQVLQLKRKEKNQKNPLHEKLVIWAGGHVRKEDSLHGDPIVSGAIRELQEELRLRVEPKQLKLLGAVYDAAPGNVSKHVAIVYEWHAESDDVNVVLNSTEFYERRGTSQSGRFIGLSDLLRCVEEDSVVESWSVKIVTQLLGEQAGVHEQYSLI